MQEMSESDLQASITECAELGGWLWWHDVDSRKNKRGLPDLILCHQRTGRLIFAELKNATRKVTPEQDEWLTTLGIRHTAVVWRPEHWQSGAIQQLLLGERRAVA